MISINKNVALAPFTTFRIGGPARAFVAASTLEQLREALDFAGKEKLASTIIGGGSNLLVSDAGFPGLIIKMELSTVQWDGSSVEAEAGVDLMQLVRDTARQGLSGLERLAGIPGTVGGAVRGNAGAYGSAIGEVVRSVLVLRRDTLKLQRIPGEECLFGYRSSRFKKDPGLVVLSAALQLTAKAPEEVEGEVRETVQRRLAKNLQAERSVGSYFMNPLVGDPHLIEMFERERQTRCRDGRIPAGWFIDRLGLRNRRHGGAVVSEKHANYLINTGNASAAEVRELAAAIKKEVLEQMGVELQEEVSCLGF